MLLETLAAKCRANVTNLLMLRNQCVKLDEEERGQLPLSFHFLFFASGRQRVGYKGFHLLKEDVAVPITCDRGNKLLGPELQRAGR